MDDTEDFVNALFGLQGKVAIVSGSTAGLGYAMAKALLQSGANVVVNGRSEERAVSARDNMYTETGRTDGLLAVAGDMSVLDEAKAVVDRTVQRFGRIDIIVNNAGVNLLEKAFEESSTEDWEHVSAVNIMGPINLTKAALPFLKQSSAGRVINVASIAGHVGMTNNTLYSMTKAAMLLFTRSLSAELASTSVTVNSISPGVFVTPMNAKFEAGTARHSEILKLIPAGRMGRAEELAGIVVYLASGASSYTNGADFLVDGGFIAI
jgi:NAD(P)-dependent dehydrogenase (short-subunit alcohol dehydrogenase family)